MNLSARLRGATIAATFLGILAFASSPIATGSGLPKGCRARHLSATMTHIPGSNGAGNTGYRLTLKNNGRRACRLGNHPGLQLLGANGRKLPTHVITFGRRGTVTIRPGHTASAALRFSPDIPGPGEPARGPCEPRAHSVIVLLRAPASGSVVGPVTPPTSVCEHGRIQERRLT